MGKGINGIKFPLGVDRPDGFSPDERMEEVRQFALDCWHDQDGNFKPIRKWIMKTRSKGSSISPPMTMREWKSWESVVGFMAWWQEEFPDLGGLTRTDLLQMEAQMWNVISDGMNAGDLKSAALYADVTAKKKHAEQQNVSGTLDEHYGDTSDDAFFDAEPAEA